MNNGTIARLTKFKYQILEQKNLCAICVMNFKNWQLIIKFNVAGSTKVLVFTVKLPIFCLLKCFLPISLIFQFCIAKIYYFVFSKNFYRGLLFFKSFLSSEVPTRVYNWRRHILLAAGFLICLSISQAVLDILVSLIDIINKFFCSSFKQSRLFIF